MGDNNIYVVQPASQSPQPRLLFSSSSSHTYTQHTHTTTRTSHPFFPSCRQWWTSSWQIIHCRFLYDWLISPSPAIQHGNGWPHKYTRIRDCIWEAERGSTPGMKQSDACLDHRNDRNYDGQEAPNAIHSCKKSERGMKQLHRERLFSTEKRNKFLCMGSGGGFLWPRLEMSKVPQEDRSTMSTAPTNI